MVAQNCSRWGFQALSLFSNHFLFFSLFAWGMYSYVHMYAFCRWELCARHHPKCCAHISSFNAHNNRIKEGLWMTPLFARWKDWAPERLISLLLIFSISSSNSTCWQKLHSWLPRTFSYFKFKISLEFLRPLLFPGWFSSSWGSCSIMTPGEGIPSLVAIICRTMASAEMFSPVWPLAQMDDPAGQRLLRGLKSHLVPSHTAHTLTTAGLLTKRPLQAHLLSLCFLAISQALLERCETVSALLRHARPGSEAGRLWRPSLCWHILLPYLHILRDISPVQ